MKILAIADEESKYLWDYFEKEKLEGIDIILSCGDLKPEYLSFLASFTKAPVLYVHGNHDDCYVNRPPEGCINIENKIFVYKGIRILGLGGSIRYKEGINQYTESQMVNRVRKMKFPLIRRKGFDILLAHAPAAGVNDGADGPHKGFEVFNFLLNKYKPKFFVHGHVHKNYSMDFKREYKYSEDTTVINGFERYIFEYPED